MSYHPAPIFPGGDLPGFLKIGRAFIFPSSAIGSMMGSDEKLPPLDRAISQPERRVPLYSEPAMPMRQLSGLFCSVATGLTLLGEAALMAEVSTGVVGYNKVVCKGGTDTVVTVPFFRKPVFTGRLESQPTGNGDAVTIDPEGSPTFTAGLFSDKPHYLRFTSGSLAGRWYEITSHDESTITINTRGDGLGQLAADDQFDVVPHWTLSTVWPEDTQEAIHISTGKLPVDRKTRVMLADVTTEGIGLAPNRIFFLTADGWFQVSSGHPPADDVVIAPGQMVVIRHPVGLTDTAFYPMQQVHDHEHEVLLRTRIGGKQDNCIGLVRPVPVALSALDLDGTSFMESGSTDPGDRKDELLVFDNLTPGLNRQPAGVFFRVGGEWREDDGDTFPVADTVTIPPSTPIVIRKSGTAGGNPIRWVNSPRY